MATFTELKEVKTSPNAIESFSTHLAIFAIAAQLRVYSLPQVTSTHFLHCTAFLRRNSIGSEEPHVADSEID
jgi:hypothetical protein